MRAQKTLYTTPSHIAHTSEYNICKWKGFLVACSFVRLSVERLSSARKRDDARDLERSWKRKTIVYLIYNIVHISKIGKKGKWWSWWFWLIPRMEINKHQNHKYHINQTPNLLLYVFFLITEDRRCDRPRPPIYIYEPRANQRFSPAQRDFDSRKIRRLRCPKCEFTSQTTPTKNPSENQVIQIKCTSYDEDHPSLKSRGGRKPRAVRLVLMANDMRTLS